MSFLIKRLLLAGIFNSCLFLFLFIGIQNSSNKSKVDFLINETIELPVSFIVGSSFILGSILGSFNVFNMNNEKNSSKRYKIFRANDSWNSFCNKCRCCNSKYISIWDFENRSLLQDLLAIFKSKNISIVFLFKSSWGKNSISGNLLILLSLTQFSYLQACKQLLKNLPQI